MGIQSEEGLKQAYNLLEAGKPQDARRVLQETLEYNLENKEISFAIWCCAYWTDYMKTLNELDVFEQSEGLISHWKSFMFDLTRQKTVHDRAVYSVQKGIFTVALRNYESLPEEAMPAQQAEILRKQALCCKKLGRYENALQLMSQAVNLMPSSPELLSEMADCFALCGEDKKAKVLFREAFFLDAQKIDLDFMESELIRCLVQQVKDKGYTGSLLLEWIPVYGVLFGVFNIKRELRSQEFGKLRQDIYARENEIKDPSADSKLLTPRLINMYFWLIDHYVRTKDDDGKIKEILLKIKLLDRAVYEAYVK